MKILYSIILIILLLLNIGLILPKTITIVKGQESINNCDALKKAILFYKAQRAGRLPDTDIPWRGNSVLTDASPSSRADSNGDGDLSKGFFDAGDGVKFALPMCWSFTILGWNYIEYQSNIESCGLSSLYLDVLRYGTDYIMASHLSANEFVAQVGDGNIDHSIWQPPEFINYIRSVYTINQDKPGTEVAMEAAAALAAASIIFKTVDSAYAAKCLSHAKQLYSFGNKYQGVYSVSVPAAANFYNSYSGYSDELVWGGVWLYKATGDSSYLNDAESYYTTKNVGYNGVGNSFDWDQTAAGSTLLLLQITGKSIYSSIMEQTMGYWLPGGGITYTPGGLAWIREWGPARYAMSMSFIASVYGTTSAISFSKAQLNYCLGNNPKGRSFIVGVGPNYPINPHHRAAHHSTTNDINNPVNNLYLLNGALVGGPGSDDSYVDDRTDYIKNEVALDYNVGLVGALSAFSKGSSTTKTPIQTSTPTPTQSTTQPTTTPSTSQSTTPIQTSTPTPTQSTTQPTATPSTSQSSTPIQTSTPTQTIIPTTTSTTSTSGDSSTTKPIEGGSSVSEDSHSNGTTPVGTTTSTSISTTGGTTTISPGVEKDGSGDSNDALGLQDIIPLSIITLFIVSSIHLLLTN